MEWSQEDVARERPILQAMAAYKYDEYQQFSPGMRFVESLALWLSQFKTVTERNLAYDFVKTRLVFRSTAEMNHLVRMAYPDQIRPTLIRKAAAEAGLGGWQVTKVARSQEFIALQRSCLFLGLSDGARIDVFRRYNGRDLSHEQVYPTYEISGGRAEVLIAKLRAALTQLSVPNAGTAKFTTVVLIDDFSASGVSYLRKEGDGYAGKIGKFFSYVSNPKNEISELIDIREAEFCILLYMATEQARSHLATHLKEMGAAIGVKCSIRIVEPLGEEIKLAAGQGEAMEPLIDGYYDNSIEDEHSEKGGAGLKYGFAKCGLPLILSHNTPNNSLALLWAKTDAVRALFPRVTRHKTEL
jgi:hypothetical protein